MPHIIRRVTRTGNSAKSIAQAALSDSEAMRYLATGIGKRVHYEVRTLCSKRVNSVQGSQDKDDIVSFP